MVRGPLAAYVAFVALAKLPLLAVKQPDGQPDAEEEQRQDEQGSSERHASGHHALTRIRDRTRRLAR